MPEAIYPFFVSRCRIAHATAHDLLPPSPPMSIYEDSNIENSVLFDEVFLDIMGLTEQELMEQGEQLSKSSLNDFDNTRETCGCDSDCCKEDSIADQRQRVRQTSGSQGAD